MSCIKPSTMAEPLMDVCPSNTIISSGCKVLYINLYTVKKEELDFSSKYELTFIRNDIFNGIVAWFECKFDKFPDEFELSADPYMKSTH